MGGEQRQASSGIDEAGDACVIAPPREDDPVEIHKPKPVHNWREFFSEIGVIVIGVLIALAGEQTAEAIHWRIKAGEAQHAIAREIANDVSNYAERIVIEPCLKAQLDRIEAYVISAPPGAAPLQLQQDARWADVFLHPTRSWSNQVWNSTAAEGTQSHLPDETRLGLEDYYSMVERMHAMAAAEGEAADALVALSKPVAIDATSRFQLVQLIEAERSRANGMAVNASVQLGSIRRVAPEALGPEGRAIWYDYLGPGSTAAWCRAHHLPLAAPPKL